MVRKFQCVLYAQGGEPLHINWFETLDEVRKFLVERAAQPNLWCVYEVERLVPFVIETNVVFT